MSFWKVALLCASIGLAMVQAPALAAGGGKDTRHASADASQRAHPVLRSVTGRRARQARAQERRSTIRRGHAAVTQRGHASIYASSLAGRRMADGGRFDPRSDSVASRTLPLGARARVTNLRNGRSAIVHVRDRGPHARHRILDVSPGVATRLGMGRTGTAPVAVTPLPGFSMRAEAGTLPRR
ncbi:septal ring lytic transglycosylase RlpA family protein [Muricoccus aerilatus]|uniref:septal ring lytic transglycosylase RlpA family protein n=1 Tax=Muricoccus aerilatus TaxID=452982 RepID=UPI001B808CC0|nr:septal ring lytic transglycosylase RlpA family protein [Roseomonas aerilata]